MKKFRHYALLLFAVLAVSACSKDDDETNSTPKVEIEKVELNPTTLNLISGEEKVLTVTITPADADQTVTWESSNGMVATVEDGKVKGKTAGTATITVTAQDGGKTATCAVTVKEKEIIGNFYYSDGTYSTEKASDKTVVGIIFWEDSANKGHGKIVSLDETQIAWGEKIQTNARDENNGVNKMNTIKAINSDYSKYPAFKWCTDKAPINGKTWYYPSVGELKQIQAQIGKVNSSLSKAGTGIKSGYVFSSSTESDQFGGKSYNTNLVLSQTDNASVGAKDMAFYVRAILAF